MPGAAGREPGLVDQLAGAAGDGIPHLGADGVGRGGAHHRPERGVRIERRSQAILLRQLDHAVDEFLVARRGDIDALDAAAGLAGIEEGAVGQGFDRHARDWHRRVRRPDPCRRARGPRSRIPRPSRATTARPPATEPVKQTLATRRVAHQPRGVGVRQVQVLEYARPERRRSRRPRESARRTAASDANA